MRVLYVGLAIIFWIMGLVNLCGPMALYPDMTTTRLFITFWPNYLLGMSVPGVPYMFSDMADEFREK